MGQTLSVLVESPKNRGHGPSAASGDEGRDQTERYSRGSASAPTGVIFAERGSPGFFPTSKVKTVKVDDQAGSILR